MLIHRIATALTNKMDDWLSSHHDLMSYLINRI